MQTVTETRIAAQLAEAIPTIEKHQFRAPAKFDGSAVPHFGFFRADNGDCLSFTAREGYEMTTADDYAALAVAAVEAMGGDGQVKAHWTQSKSMAQATIIVAPSKQQRLDGFDIGGGDYIWPRLIIEAPFGKKFTTRGGLYRDLCRNLSIPRVQGAEFHVSLTHTSSLRPRMNELIELFAKANNFEALMNRCRQLNSIKVSVVDFLTELYPVASDASNNTLTRAKNRAAAIYQRIARESLETTGNTAAIKEASLWQIVSAITGYVQHDKTRKNGLGIVDLAVMGLVDTETANAWSLVDSMSS